MLSFSGNKDSNLMSKLQHLTFFKLPVFPVLSLQSTSCRLGNLQPWGLGYSLSLITALLSPPFTSLCGPLGIRGKGQHKGAENDFLFLVEM